MVLCSPTEIVLMAIQYRYYNVRMLVSVSSYWHNSQLICYFTILNSLILLFHNSQLICYFTILTQSFVTCSLQKHGVSILDHHSGAESFMKFMEQEVRCQSTQDHNCSKLNKNCKLFTTTEHVLFAPAACSTVSEEAAQLTGSGLCPRCLGLLHQSFTRYARMVVGVLLNQL